MCSSSKMKHQGMACDECSKKCLKLHGSRKPVGSSSESLSFFKIMLGKFETTLFLPPKCSCKMLKLVNRIAYLEDSEGSSWRVEISLIKNVLAFQEGWHKFIEDHNIKIGEVVMFKYLGSLKFSVQIFGTSGCERVQFPVKETCNASKSKRVREASPSGHLHSHKCDASNILEEKSFIPNDGSSKRKKTAASLQASHLFQNGDVSLKSSYQAEQFHRSEPSSEAKCTEAPKSNRLESPSTEKYTEAHKTNRPEPPSAEKYTEAHKSNRSEPPSAAKYTEAQKSNRFKLPSEAKYTEAHKAIRPEAPSAEKYTETQKSNFMSNEFVDYNKSRKTKKYAKRCYGTRETSFKEANVLHQQNANLFVKVFPGLEKESRKPDYGHPVASTTHHLSVEQHKHDHSEVVHNQGTTNSKCEFSAAVAKDDANAALNSSRSMEFSAVVGKDDEMTPVSVVENNCIILVTESGTCILVDKSSVVGLVAPCHYTVADVNFDDDKMNTSIRESQDTLLTEEKKLRHRKNSTEQSSDHPRMEGISPNTSNMSADATCKVHCIMDGGGFATLVKDKPPFLQSDPNSSMLVSECIGNCFPGGNFKDGNKFLSFTSEAPQEEDSWDIQFYGTLVAENCSYRCVEGGLNSTMMVDGYHENHGAASCRKDNIMLVDAYCEDPLSKDGGEIGKDKSPHIGTDLISSMLVPECNGSSFPGGNSKDCNKFLSSTSEASQKDSWDIRPSGTSVAENNNDRCVEGGSNSTVVVHGYHENHDPARCPKDSIMLINAARIDPLSKDGGEIELERTMFTEYGDVAPCVESTTVTPDFQGSFNAEGSHNDGGKDKSPHLGTDLISSMLVPECNGSSFPGGNSKDCNKFLSSTSEASQKDSWDIRPSGTSVAENNNDPCVEGGSNSTVVVHGYHENHDTARCPKDSIMLIDAASIDPLSKDGGEIELERTMFTEYGDVALCVENTTVTPDFQGSFNAEGIHIDVPKVDVENVKCYPQEKVWDIVNIETTDAVMLPPSDQVKFCFPLSADIRPWHDLSEPLPSKKKRHERRVVFFRDSFARVWPVLYHESARFVGFLGGWQAFASAQNIEEGDTCMLEIVDESESTFNAIVCRK